MDKAITFCVFALATDQILRYLHRRETNKQTVEKTRALAKLICNANPLLLKSGLELGEMIKAGELTSVELTLLCMEQIDRCNLYTNAMVASRFDLALQEAHARDDNEKQNKDLVFWGVPIFSKEVFELPGMPLSAGVVQLAQRFGRNTCFALEQVQSAGLVILGSGNVSEQCMWMESTNNVYGTTNNAYDLGRTVGGSSGGTASVVSTLGAPLAVTSDVGGSTRIPSLYNGVFGLKPTGGSVSNFGTTPSVHHRVNWFCQLGPCATHAEDLMPLLRILTSQPAPKTMDKVLPTKSPQEASRNWTSDRVPLRDLKVMTSFRQFDTSGPLQWFRHARERGMIEAHVKLVQVLGEVEQVDFPAFSQAFDIWSAYLGRETIDVPFRMILAEGKPGAGSFWWVLKELVKFGVSLGRWSDHTLPALALGVVEAVEALLSSKNRALIEAGERLKQDLSNALGSNGVLIVPSLPTVAPKHGPLPFLLRASESGAAGIFNVLEFPSVAVPLGLDAQGLPMGVQIVANHGNDHLCLSLARLLEQELNAVGWQPPNMLN
ncbi:hypothetical protein BASA81_001332 [Batrachochytrium salamandrivorans]|nr:hypothetical protein BASA81_001332 [Batrachochytrium salamandrivorans]